MRGLREKLYGDADHVGAGERQGPMSELRQREGYASTDGVYRENLAEELNTEGSGKVRAFMALERRAQVTCPRHAANFDLRTGAVLGPPAQPGVKSWTDSSEK